MNDATQQNNKKLYVGNLPYSTTEADLSQLFGQYGELVSVALITEKMTGRSKGFGFVEFADEAAAKAALEATQTMSLGDRPLMVKVARPLVPREFGQGGGQGGNRGGGYDRRPRNNDRYGR